MRKVLIFKETLLPPSETFILAQMNGLNEYVPVLAGLERVYPSLPLPARYLLLSSHRSSVADARAKLYRRTGFAPVFHARATRAHPDLIHAHFASGGRTALPLARKLGIPLLVTLHGKDVTVRDRHPDRYRRLAQEASCFICVSKFIRDRALEAGFPPHKLLVHSIGINRDVFSSSVEPSGSPSILFVGRLVEKKGCEYLLRAMQRVQRKHPKCELMIIGDGLLRQALEALADELNVRCRFLGSQPEGVVREALRSTRIFCAPSVTASDGDSEGLGMVFAEALAMGIPVVSTNHGGIPEIVSDQVTGLLTPERDDALLAEALSLLLEDDGLWQRFHKAGPAYIEQHFDLATQTALLEQIYSQAVSLS